MKAKIIYEVVKEVYIEGDMKEIRSKVNEIMNDGCVMLRSIEDVDTHENLVNRLSEDYEVGFGLDGDWEN